MLQPATLKYSKTKQYLPLLGIATIAIIGAMVLLYATNVWGIGIEPDSIVYVSAANSLQNKHELIGLLHDKFVPLTHFPPLYSIILFLSGIIDIPLLERARILHVLVFAMNSAVTGFIIHRATRGSWWLAALGSYAMIVMPDNLLVHTTLMSEPIFLFFELVGFFLLSLAVERKHTGLLIASALVISAAFLQRYVGIVLVATGVVELFLFSHNGNDSEEKPSLLTTLRKRFSKHTLYQIFIFGTVACLPIAVWIVRNILVTGNSANRVFLFHPISIHDIESLLYTITTWIVPYTTIPYINTSPLQRGLRILLLGAGIITGIMLWRKQPRGQHIAAIKQMFTTTPILRIFALFSFLYISFLFVSISFMDVSTPLNYRILLPIYVPLMVIVLCITWGLVKNYPSSRIHRYFVASCIIIVGLYTIGGYDITREIRAKGWWFNNEYWQKCQLIDYIVEQVPPETPIYSNGPNVIYLFTGRKTPIVPFRIEPTTRLPRTTYESEIDTMVEDIENNGAIVIYFSAITWCNCPTGEQLNDYTPVEPILQTPDGTVYATSAPKKNVSR